MSTVQEIEAAIAKLKPAEIKKVAAWISDNYAGAKRITRINYLRQARGMWKDRQDLPNIRPCDVNLTAVNRHGGRLAY